jgi:hypothetical protein
MRMRYLQERSQSQNQKANQTVQCCQIDVFYIILTLFGKIFVNKNAIKSEKVGKVALFY